MLLFSNCLDRPGQWFIDPDSGSVIHRGAPDDSTGMTTFTHYRAGGPMENREHAAAIQAAAAETWRWLIGKAPKVPVQFIERDSIDGDIPAFILCESAENPDHSWLYEPAVATVFPVNSEGYPVGNKHPGNERIPDHLIPTYVHIARGLIAAHAAADALPPGGHDYDTWKPVNPGDPR